MPSLLDRLSKDKTGSSSRPTSTAASSSINGTPPSYNASGAAGSSGTPGNPPSYSASGNDHSVADGQIPADLRVPPSEEEISKVNLTEAFDKLTLDPKPAHPDVDKCLAHLKLLFAIQTMKEEVGYTDGLWNIWDSRADHGAESALAEMDSASSVAPGQQEVQDKKLEILSKIREKRWTIFLARAVDRYEAWWSSLQPANGGLKETDMQLPTWENYGMFVNSKDDMFGWLAENLPPLGK